MTIETKYNIDELVYFINNDYKIDCGQITAIKFLKKNHYGLSDYNITMHILQSPITYTIEGIFDRNEDYVFKTKEELLKSL